MSLSLKLSNLLLSSLQSLSIKGQLSPLLAVTLILLQLEGWCVAEQCCAIEQLGHTIHGNLTSQLKHAVLHPQHHLHAAAR